MIRFIKNNYKRLLLFLLILFTTVMPLIFANENEANRTLYSPDIGGYIYDFGNSGLYGIAIFMYVVLFLLIIGCYAVGRIWKGLSYIAIGIVALIYYILMY